MEDDCLANPEEGHSMQRYMPWHRYNGEGALSDGIGLNCVACIIAGHKESSCMGRKNEQ